LIKKIVKLEGIGRFEQFKATGDVTFAKYTLIFAENGVGKTTLCDVIRSLQTGDANYINGRKTLGSTVEPKATILLADGRTAQFGNGVWSHVPAGKCTIFDQSYVRDNVYARPTLSRAFVTRSAGGTEALSRCRSSCRSSN
jgi:ABC-type branched-subunit amino acid transport system ATPase component